MVERSLARIRERDAELNAWITVLDERALRGRAQRSQEERVSRDTRAELRSNFFARRGCLATASQLAPLTRVLTLSRAATLSSNARTRVDR